MHRRLETSGHENCLTTHAAAAEISVYHEKCDEVRAHFKEALNEEDTGDVLQLVSHLLNNAHEIAQLETKTAEKRLSLQTRAVEQLLSWSREEINHALTDFTNALLRTSTEREMLQADEELDYIRAN